MTDEPVGELIILRRTGTVEDYTDKFLALACRDADLLEAQLIQMFTAWLVNPLKTDVALRRPQSLDDAIMFARAYEQRLHIAPADQYQGRSTRYIQQSTASSQTLKTAQAHYASNVSILRGTWIGQDHDPLIDVAAPPTLAWGDGPMPRRGSLLQLRREIHSGPPL
jgi:hypothetical protein